MRPHCMCYWVGLTAHIATVDCFFYVIAVVYFNNQSVDANECASAAQVCATA